MAIERVPHTRVIVEGISIPFFDLMWLLVKLSLAVIPAAIIIFLIYLFLGLFAGTLVV